MKKIVMLLLCGGILVACSQSSYNVKVSDDSEVLVSTSEMNVTKQGYFEYLLDQYGSNEVLNQALNTIADKEVTDTDAIEKLLQERINDYAKYADGDIEKYAKSLGYDSKDDYVDKVLRLSVKVELLRNKYIEENLKNLISEYQVTSFKKIIVEKESEALALIKESTSEDIFDQKLKNAGNKGEDAGIVTKESSLDDNLKTALEKLSALKEDGVYSEAIKLSDDTYAVVYVYNTAHQNTQDIINALTKITDLQDKITGIYLKKYNFEVHDKKIKADIKKLSSEYIE